MSGPLMAVTRTDHKVFPCPFCGGEEHSYRAVDAHGRYVLRGIPCACPLLEGPRPTCEVCGFTNGDTE